MQKLATCEELVFLSVCKKEDPPALQEIMNEVNQLYQKNWKPQTVSTFLARLVKKGYLTMQRRGRYAYYSPVISLEKYQKIQVRGMVDYIFSGNIEQMQEYLDLVKKELLEERRGRDEEA